MKLRTAAAGTVFLSTVFILAPIGMVRLNDALGWPLWRTPVSEALGGALMIASLAVILYCSNLFSRIGGGTPVPVEPPRHLVIGGLYRYSRNPIYVAQVGILLGLFLHRGEAALLLYTCIWAGLVHTLVVRREEPELARRFGPEYERYRARVPRWIGRGYPE
jgi:protein-S-isoprenylcysteine O-methyltransferase Ste14